MINDKNNGAQEENQCADEKCPDEIREDHRKVSVSFYGLFTYSHKHDKQTPHCGTCFFAKNGYIQFNDLPTAQTGAARYTGELPGHSDVRTTQIYTHLQHRGGLVAKSPLGAVLKIGWGAAPFASLRAEHNLGRDCARY